MGLDVVQGLRKPDAVAMRQVLARTASASSMPFGAVLDREREGAESVSNSKPANAGVKGGGAALRERYNLRCISYSDLQAMTHELLESGELKAHEFLDFLPPSTEFASINGTRNADWDAPRDYVGMLEDQIKYQKAYFPGESVKHLEYQLSLKMRFV